MEVISLFCYGSFKIFEEGKNMLTRIVVIRHAKPCSEGYVDDTLRPLSEKGKAAQKWMAEQLKEMEIIPSYILTSPFVRAMETAQIISEVYGHIPVISTEHLGDEFDTKKILALITPPENHETIFLVGHAPTLSQFISDMLGSSQSRRELSTSSATLIDFYEIPNLGNGTFSGYYCPPPTWM